MMRYVLRIMERAFFERSAKECSKNWKAALHYLSIYREIGSHLGRLDSPAYTKNDFFHIVTIAIE